MGVNKLYTSGLLEVLSVGVASVHLSNESPFPLGDDSCLVALTLDAFFRYAE